MTAVAEILAARDVGDYLDSLEAALTEAVARDGGVVAAVGGEALAAGGKRLRPLLGRLLPGGKAYTYLPASVRRFPGAEGLVAVLEQCGFADVRFRLLGGTIVALHSGRAA